MGGTAGAERRWQYPPVGALEQQHPHLRLGVLQRLGHGGPQQIALGRNRCNKAQVTNGQPVGGMQFGLPFDLQMGISDWNDLTCSHVGQGDLWPGIQR